MLNYDNLRILIIAHDVPYPPTHGGRVDMWNRIKALDALGSTIYLIAWADENVTNDNLTVIQEHVEHVVVLKRIKAPYLGLHPLYPHTVATRRPERVTFEQLLRETRDFSPHLVMLDGIHGWILARRLCEQLSVPLVYRSHNVEYSYIKKIFLVEPKVLRKMVLALDVPKMYFLERSIRRKSAVVFDISDEDRQKWAVLNRHFERAKVLHPVILAQDENITDKCLLNTSVDVLYVGNLFSPNNIDGLKWFLTKVRPLLNGLRIKIAGSNPSTAIRELLLRSGVEYEFDVEDVSHLYEQAKVLINPVWKTEGVNMKMIEMLATGKPVVTTVAGVKGLPSAVASYVTVANEPESFANAIKEAHGRGVNLKQKDETIRIFGMSSIVEALDIMRMFVKLVR
ncbi:MAG TPA: glycosyltransferase family 4 protein [Syntrophothermus lipocalidus]|nr:glycosyltransferase family 4 protein [Syntrophothermus lipocalidus]